MPTALTEQEVQAALQQLKGWEGNTDLIKKHFKFNDFSQALAFIVQVGLHAEKQGHHPELKNVYNNVWIELRTHDADNKVSQKDIDLAKAIEGLL